MSISTTSSFEVVSNRSRSSTASSGPVLVSLDPSDDEIVWSIDDSSSAAASDDFVVLNRSNAPDDSLVDQLARLSVTTPKRRRRQRRSPPATPPPATAPVATKSSRRRKNAMPSGLGSRPIVDDLDSERDESESVSSTYEAAASYISASLEDKTTSCRLTFMQCLLVEFGLASSSLPASLTAAKAMLKSKAFVVLGDYLAVRQHGPAAIQSVMHKSRSSLIRDLRTRKRGAMVPREFAKETGLQVLLVRCYY
ncbi:hypothetical protein C8F01DRAFT_1250709 [Mycena amicta]|nr:hypothetical protein C8F01DRAFT_1250709 [Mycena amicta]